MTTRLIVFCFATLMAFQVAFADGNIEMVDGRAKVQFRVPSPDSQGSFELRSLLQKDGYVAQDGFVKTGSALFPLELYNYLYENGDYVFTVYLPVDSHFFVSFGSLGFVSFSGSAAKKLFEVVSRHVPRDEVQSLEQYKWGRNSYCDRTLDGSSQYRCFIER